MQTKVEIKERDKGGIVEITTPINGNVYSISFEDHSVCIKVQTVIGSMSIHPSVSNEVKIFTNTD